MKKILLALLCVVFVVCTTLTLTACYAPSENKQGLDFFLKDDGTYAVAVGNAKDLSHVEIPATYHRRPVTEIADNAWIISDVDNQLISIILPNTITTIGNYAFAGCTSLSSITIPNSVTSIGDYAFHECTSLSSITIPNSVTSIGDYAFHECTSLSSITIPNSVTSIGNSAFSYCSSLSSITIPNSVTSIGDYAFSGCDSLSSITIPNSVESLGVWVFKYCSSLTIYCEAASQPNGWNDYWNRDDRPVVWNSNNNQQ